MKNYTKILFAVILAVFACIGIDRAQADDFAFFHRNGEALDNFKNDALTYLRAKDYTGLKLYIDNILPCRRLVNGAAPKVCNIDLTDDKDFFGHLNYLIYFSPRDIEQKVKKGAVDSDFVKDFTIISADLGLNYAFNSLYKEVIGSGTLKKCGAIDHIKEFYGYFEGAPQWLTDKVRDSIAFELRFCDVTKQEIYAMLSAPSVNANLANSTTPKVEIKVENNQNIPVISEESKQTEIAKADVKENIAEIFPSPIRKCLLKVENVTSPVENCAPQVENATSPVEVAEEQTECDSTEVEPEVIEEEIYEIPYIPGLDDKYKIAFMLEEPDFGRAYINKLLTSMEDKGSLQNFGYKESDTLKSIATSWFHSLITPVQQAGEQERNFYQGNKQKAMYKFFNEEGWQMFVKAGVVPSENEKYIHMISLYADACPRVLRGTKDVNEICFAFKKGAEESGFYVNRDERVKQQNTEIVEALNKELYHLEKGFYNPF